MDFLLAICRPIENYRQCSDRLWINIISKFKEGNHKNYNSIFLIGNIDCFSGFLQLRISEYLRSLVKQGAGEGRENESDLRFVIVTHSSHLMNSAIKGEDFLC
jgi:hypothetical protein